MKKYSDYQEDKSKEDLSKKEWDKVKWTKYKIVVPTDEDRKELMEAFRHIHDSDVDVDNIVVNQLIHEYLDEEEIEGAKNNIVVDKQLYNQLNS